MRRQSRFLALVASLAFLVTWGVSRLTIVRGAADEPGRQRPGPEEKSGTSTGQGSRTWTTAVTPKPLSRNVKKGLDWLVEHQLPGGGWGQGDESVNMGGGGESFKDIQNVADTCIAVLALIRSGSTPRDGLYRDAITKGVRHVRLEVEKSDAQSIAVTGVRGTRVQQKLGPNIDTFLASILLAEVRGRMPDEASEKATDLALHKVLGKIERHQKQDGAFDGQGWAPILAQAMCGKGINRARQAGARVSDVALARAENGAKVAFEAAKPTTAGSSGGETAKFATRGMGGMMGGGMSGSAGSKRVPGRTRGGPSGMMGRAIDGSAGVELYSRAASVGVLSDSGNTNKVIAEELREKAANSNDKKQQAEAKAQLAQFADAETVQKNAQAAMVSRLADKQFVAGFGSNGGEEFLSYMNIAESLVVKGGDEWKRWDSEMTQNLNRVQNDDGSWSGHHCITGRSFCTSTALLVLMADRTPVPVEAKANAGGTGK